MTTYQSVGKAGKPNNPIYQSGKRLRQIVFRKTITDAESEVNDLYILGGPLSYDARVHSIVGANPAQTSNNDADLGFYKEEEDGTYTAIDADILWDGADLSSAITYRNLLTHLNSSLDTTKTIGELLSKTSEQEPVGGVYLGLLNKVLLQLVEL
jgi:hypothetical protein